MKIAVVAVAVLCLLGVYSVAAAPLTNEQYEFLFTRFVEQYSKQYEVDQFFTKFNTFKNNLNYILAQNSKNLSYTLAMNEFGDMTSEEFKAKMTGLIPREAPYADSQLVAKDLAPVNQDTFDWRDKGAVTPMKNQGQCGSCWAFSATGSLEGAWKIAKGELIDLSEQQLNDCSSSYGNHGCNGGLMTNAFEYVIRNGICATKDYPYTARDETCKKTCSPVVRISGYRNVPARDEAALKAAITQVPVSIAVQADRMPFQFYSSGVLDDAGCGTALNHGILAVGYGVEGGKPYYAAKNSWGTSWGDKGYVKIVQGKNMCGVSQMNSYAVV